ncbi:MAG TPA: BMP family ABC transporter substrate-binding protein [Bacilli bacterium]|nr:BMP family ABC transporter substrate-binding protein [Bacilli bacterium]
MKKNNFLVKFILPFIAVIVAACTPSGSSDSSNGSTPVGDGKTKIALLINGNLGDMSFFDSAAAGMEKFKKDYPEVVVDIVEMGTDNTRWEPTLRLTANDDYDLIIVGTNDMREPLQRVTKNKRYDDKRFILFDAEIEDDKAADYPTVHSVLFKQNEGGYLAGALAALMTLDANKTKTGFIGGMKIDIINDFGYGFMQGVNKVNDALDQNVLAYNSYIGDFFNSPKGKTLADTMFNEGDVEVLFAAASQAGLGTFDSAKNNNKYVIGVDSDQYEYFADVDVAKAERIVTSVLKRVDLTLYELSEQFLNDELEYAVLQYEGLKEGKIGIVQNDNYKSIVSLDNQTFIEGLIAEIISGDIVVESGLRRFTSTAALNAYYDSLDPNKQ